MAIIETLLSISESPFLMKPNFKFCLIDSNKLPYKIDGSFAKSNRLEDFVNFEILLDCASLTKYAGVAISVQASNICAIDVDHCFKIPFDVNSGDERALAIIDLFRSFAYIEFSFSGKGLRILFDHSSLENYSDIYYIKNSKNGIEYYQPKGSFRYISVTGKTICNGEDDFNESSLTTFLDAYMKRPVPRSSGNQLIFKDDRPIEEIMVNAKKQYYKDSRFQDIWFSKAPGSGKNESELDFWLVGYIFENITADKHKCKLVFESSPYFQSKDFKHRSKWNRSDNQYYYYMYDRIKKGL